MLTYSITNACLEHSNFLTVNDGPPAAQPVKATRHPAQNFIPTAQTRRT